MNELVVAALGVAATVTVAAMAGIFKMLKLFIEQMDAQTEYRHKLRDDLTSIVLNAENRCTRRIERLEIHSIGFRHARDIEDFDHNGE